MTEISFQDIRARAYELWERHHRPDGFEIELWVMAEQELKAERERALAAGKADRPPDGASDDATPEPDDGR